MAPGDQGEKREPREESSLFAATSRKASVKEKGGGGDPVDYEGGGGARCKEGIQT